MKIIERILDSIFPPRESEYVIRSVSVKSICALYQLKHIAEGVSLSPYRHPTIRSLITENKFHNSKHAAKMLFELIKTWRKTQTQTLIFVPVPLGEKRERERGYNQVSEVLQYFKAEDSTSVRFDLCSRTKETLPQLSLPRNERLHNVRNAFTGNSATLSTLSNTTIVVVDDVCTTGATLRAAAAALAPHLHPSCKIICLALAH